MSEHQVDFVDLTDKSFPECSPDGMQPARDWSPVCDQQERKSPRKSNGWPICPGRPPAGGRPVLSIPVHHPMGQGLTPGVKFTIDVLKPGEKTEPIRHNSTQVNFCIQGGGHTLVDGTENRVWPV